jgi:hypothetical protein
MPPISRFLTTSFLLFAAGLPAHAQFGEPDRQVLVTTDNEAYVLLPPELIAAPAVQQVAMSKGGRYIVVSRAAMRLTPKLVQEHLTNKFAGPPPGEASLILWDSKTRVAKEIWKGDSNTTRVESLHWLGDSEVGLALIREDVPATPQHPQTESRQALLRISALGSRPQVVGLTELGDIGHLQLHVSPAEPLAVLEQNRIVPVTEPNAVGGSRGKYENHRAFYLMGPNGRPGASVRLPKEVEAAQILWSETGDPVLMAFEVVDKKPRQKWFLMDRRTAALKPLEKAPPLHKEPVQAPQPVRLKTARTTAKEGATSQPISTLWLEGAATSEAPRALVSSDSPGGMVLPGTEGIVYGSQGALWAAPLVRMPKEVYLLARQAAERTRIVSNAKQLGLAALMYAQDYDENLPTPEGINGKLEPYLKSSSLFEGFSYTFGGGALASIDSPAETELGYVTGPGGRAVIYVDGHVKWKPD